MSDAAITALIGAVSAAVVWLIKHWLDQRTAAHARRREQIERWRTMVREVNQQYHDENKEAGQLLQLHEDFPSLEPHLSETTRLSVYGDNRTIVVGQSLSVSLENVKKDIAKVEKEWPQLMPSNQPAEHDASRRPLGGLERTNSCPRRMTTWALK